MRTPTHAKKLAKTQKGLNRGVQKTFLQCVASTSQRSEQDEFNEDLCRFMLSADIPLSKLRNEDFRHFLQKYCKHAVPDESTLRKKFVTKCHEEVLSEIRKTIGENYFYIIVDETTDSSGRYIAHLLIGVLSENCVGKSYLIASKQLEKTNNLTITRFVQESLASFYLPDSVPTEKFLLFLTDGASYMTKAAQNLKIFYQNLTHNTCLAHALNLVADEIRQQFPQVNQLISKVKKIFVKAPLRVQFYKERLPNTPLPPEPILTRWGTWLKAAIFYADHFDAIKTVVSELTDSNCAALQECKELLTSFELSQNLSFIKGNYGFVPDSILKLETQGMSLLESIGLINDFEASCKNVTGKIGTVVLKKFRNVIDKNSGYSVLQNVAKILEGEVVTNFDLSPQIIVNLKNAPITSVDVERSFSVYKHMYTDKRHKFLPENFEKYLIVKCFRSISTG